MVMSFRVSFSHSFPHFSNTCFDIFSWNLVCHFLYMNIQSSSSIVGVMPLLELRILEIHSFTHFSLTCFDILSWNCAYDFVLLYYRSTLSVINSRQFLLELCPFLNLEYWKYTLHFSALFSYMLDILSLNLFYCTRDQVGVSSIFVGVMPLLELRILEIYSFSHFSPTCFNILNWNFAYDFVLLYFRFQVRVSSICFNFCRSYAPFIT